LRGQVATITLNLAYHNIVTTQECGERLIAWMEENHGLA
jgi:hypothetical protein